MITLPRRNQKTQLDPAVAQFFNSLRQIFEMVNAQLVEQLHIQTNPTHSFWGLCAPLLTKLTAHTLLVYINRLRGDPDVLRIKRLAFLS